MSRHIVSASSNTCRATETNSRGNEAGVTGGVATGPRSVDLLSKEDRKVLTDLTGRRASKTYVAPVGATMTEFRRPGMFTLVEDGLRITAFEPKR